MNVYKCNGVFILAKNMLEACDIRDMNGMTGTIELYMHLKRTG